MGLFGGSSRSRTTTTQTSNTTNIKNTTNIDNRQDNRQFIDNSQRTTIDARQDNRQFIDNRKTVRNTTNIDARQDNRVFNDNRSTTNNFVDESVSVADGGIFAGENATITITEVDEGAVDASFRFAESAFAQSLDSVQELVGDVLNQSESGLAEANQRNLLIMGGLGLVTVAAATWMARKAA